MQESVPRFDPQTGEPLPVQPQPARFDPQTGELLAEQTRPAPQTQAKAQAVGQSEAAAPVQPQPSQAEPSQAEPSSQPQIIGTNAGAKDGINKCPSCGSSDIALNPQTGKLHCNYCHREWSEAADTLNGDIRALHGVVLGSGSGDIIADASDILTLKCAACGAEVVIDTAEAPQARCHWCRNTLSVNQQVPNGAVPDVVVPFRLTKQQAQQHIEAFVGKRRFFAHPQFKVEFTTENIMGVYLPYMVIDVNAHAQMSGQGEHLVRRYTRGSGNDKKTFYDADLFDVGREFDLLIDDLTVEARADRLQQDAAVNSNNVINAIMPFPLDEAVHFNANYLRGFTSEKRDTNRDELVSLATAQSRDIARMQVKQTTAFYDRGIRWDNENLEMRGQLWKSAYLPVWLYSYLQVKKDGSKFLHYVACNGVTGETMGSIPLHIPRLLAVSAVVEAVGLAVGAALFVVYFLM